METTTEKPLAEMTKKELKAHIKGKIAENDFWAARAVLAIYANQTGDEQASHATRHDNGVGFNGRDAEFFSSIACQLKERGFSKETKDRVPLSDKQRACIRKGMQKYAGQLMALMGK